MVQLTGEQRLCCRSLFADVPIWRAFIESALESGYGQIVADSDSDPEAAVLFYGGLVVYAGDYDTHAADDLVRFFDVQPAILGYSTGWNRRIMSAFGDRLAQVERYHLPHSGLDHAVAEQILNQNVVPYRAIEADDYVLLQDALDWEHHLHHFVDMEDFLGNGNGFLIVKDGQIVSGASSYVVSENYSECQVTTIVSARRTGYAQLMSAAYLRRCREKGMSTPWDAANDASFNLARKVGFSDVSKYYLFELF